MADARAASQIREDLVKNVDVQLHASADASFPLESPGQSLHRWLLERSQLLTRTVEGLVNCASLSDEVRMAVLLTCLYSTAAPLAGGSLGKRKYRTAVNRQDTTTGLITRIGASLLTSLLVGAPLCQSCQRLCRCVAGI